MVNPQIAAGQYQKAASLSLRPLLLIAWICALLWGTGFFLIAAGVVGAVVVAALGMGSSSTPFFSWPCIAGPALVLAAPIFLGHRLNYGPRGIISGLLGLPAAIGGYLLLSALVSLAFKVLGLRSMSGLSPSSFVSLVIASTAAAAVCILVLVNTEIRLSNKKGLALGVGIGLILSVIDGLVLGRGLLLGNNALHLLWQIPPLVWTSAVYFSEPSDSASRLREFPAWLILILVALVLPFIVVPLLAHWF
jgi:hypothetical protein